MKRKFYILLLVAVGLLSGCGMAAEAAAPCGIPVGVQFLAWVGVVTIVVAVFGIVLMFWPWNEITHPGPPAPRVFASRHQGSEI